jgi:transposase
VLRVRELGLAEGQALSRLAKTTRDVTVFKRASVILHSYQGFSAPDIARMLSWSVGWVRRVIRDYNRMGRDALFPEKAPGAEPTFKPRDRQRLVDLAFSSPRDHGMPVQTWSLDRLRDTAIREGLVEHISRERLRQILHEESASYQAVKTWKSSNDPKFQEKMRRIRALTGRRHNPPIVVSGDEMGPIQLKPHGGRSWARVGHPDRVRATYKRTMGVRYLMGAYDYFHDVFHGYLSRRKTGADWVRYLRYVRSWYPGDDRIFLIQDNLSTHTTPAASAEARRLNIQFIPTPTNASHLNPIECHFGEIKNLALTHSDYRDWATLGRAVQGAIRWRNKNRAPKVKKAKRLMWLRH